MKALEKMPKRKWWTAIATTQEAVDAGAYEVSYARTRRQAAERARRAVGVGAIVAYAVKHRRSVVCVRTPGATVCYDGLKCREWTPLGEMTFIPGIKP